LRQHLVDQRKGRSFTNIVRSRLEGDTPDGQGLSLKVFAEMLLDLRRQDAFLLDVDAIDGVHEIDDDPQRLSKIDEGIDVFRKAGAAVTRTRVQKLEADSLVVA